VYNFTANVCLPVKRFGNVLIAKNLVDVKVRFVSLRINIASVSDFLLLGTRYEYSYLLQRVHLTFLSAINYLRQGGLYFHHLYLVY